MEKVLKTGRKIEMKELSALEEILAYQLLGENFDPDKVVASVILQRSVCAVLCMESVDDKPVVTPAKLEDVYSVLAKFKKREWDEVMDLYDAVNGDVEELPKK